MKDEIGTERDNDDLRKRVKEKQDEMGTQAKDLEKQITAYGQISVQYRAQQMQRDKQEAYNRRLAEIVNKFR